jgi:hypothetical protein
VSTVFDFLDHRASILVACYGRNYGLRSGSYDGYGNSHRNPSYAVRIFRAKPSVLPVEFRYFVTICYENHVLVKTLLEYRYVCYTRLNY